MTTKRKRKCVVCGKQIVLFRSKQGSNGNIKFILYSNGGVLFLKKWFCNNCWKEIGKLNLESPMI